jgi:hypothetical protein
VVQADPVKPKLKPPETQRLKLECDMLLSTSAFKSNFRLYTKELRDAISHIRNQKVLVVKVTRCRLTLCNPS